MSAPDVDFDPFKARVDKKYHVSDWGTLAHILCACLGTGTLAMPVVFSKTGLVLGIFTVIVTMLVIAHCANVLVQCSQELCRRTGTPIMGFVDVIEEACLQGPQWSRRLGHYAKVYILVGIFLIYFATCSCYSVIMADNIQKVLLQHFHKDWIGNARIMISLLLLPLLVLGWIPHLKHLAPVSFVGTVCMITALIITFSFLVRDVLPVSDRALVKNLSELPIAISLIIYAGGTIGTVLPLENHMKNPGHFLGWCGVFNRGMFIVVDVYVVLGFLGYLQYGEGVKGVITLNLPTSHVAAQVVMIMVSLAVFCCFGEMFYICNDMAWIVVQKYSNTTRSNYILRTVLLILAVLLGVAVPSIVPFLSLIGALFCPTLALIAPIFADLLTFWEQGFGKYNWKIFRNAVVIVLTVITLIFGTISSIEGIVKIYEPQKQLSVNSTKVT